MPSLRFYVIIPDRGRMRYVSDRTHLADVVSGSRSRRMVDSCRLNLCRHMEQESPFDLD